MFEKLIDWFGMVGGSFSLGVAFGVLGLFGALVFFVLGWNSEKREWWVRAILVTSAICYLMGSLLNDLSEYRMFYDLETGGMSSWAWVENVRYLQRSELAVHFCSALSFAGGICLQFLSSKCESPEY